MTTLYKKVGRRYRPVAEHEEWDSYPEGAHLVICHPGSTMCRFSIDPDRAGLLAAAEPLRAETLRAGDSPRRWKIARWSQYSSSVHESQPAATRGSSATSSGLPANADTLA